MYLWFNSKKNLPSPVLLQPRLSHMSRMRPSSPSILKYSIACHHPAGNSLLAKRRIHKGMINLNDIVRPGISKSASHFLSVHKRQICPSSNVHSIFATLFSDQPSSASASLRFFRCSLKKCFRHLFCICCALLFRHRSFLISRF